MPDNVVITAGTGTTIHADEYTHATLGSGKTQLVKLVTGELDSGTGIYAGGGLEANAMRVTIASDSTGLVSVDDNGGSLTVDGTVTETNSTSILADTTAIKTAVELLDNAVDGSYLNTNCNIAGTDIVGGAGAVAAGVQRITLASDDPAVALLGTIDTDTGNIATSLGNIDNAVDGNYLNVNMNLAGTDAQAGEGLISANTLRVTIATDDDGIAHLATIAGDTTSLDSKVTACNTGAVVLSSGTVTTVSTVTNLSQLGGAAINMGEGTIDTGTQRVTLATDDDGVAHLATIAGDTTNIETAIQIMDDWDATHASAAPADGVQVMGAGYSTSLPADVGADADAARLVTDRYGRLCVGLQPQAARAIVNNADTTTAREIVAATASRKVYVTSLIISVDTAGNYWLEDGDATAVTGKMYFAANGGCAITFPEGTPLSTPTANKALYVKGSTAGNVGVTITYYLAP